MDETKRKRPIASGKWIIKMNKIKKREA